MLDSADAKSTSHLGSVDQIHPRPFAGAVEAESAPLPDYDHDSTL